MATIQDPVALRRLVQDECHRGAPVSGTKHVSPVLDDEGDEIELFGRDDEIVPLDQIFHD